MLEHAVWAVSSIENRLEISVASLEKAEPSDTVRHRGEKARLLRNLTRQHLNDFP